MRQLLLTAAQYPDRRTCLSYSLRELAVSGSSGRQFGAALSWRQVGLVGQEESVTGLVLAAGDTHSPRRGVELAALGSGPPGPLVNHVCRPGAVGPQACSGESE